MEKSFIFNVKTIFLFYFDFYQVMKTLDYLHIYIYDIAKKNFFMTYHFYETPQRLNILLEDFHPYKP